MNGLREIRSRSNGNGRKEEVPENIDVVAVRDPGFELAGRQGVSAVTLRTPVKTRDCNASLSIYRFSVFGF